jgi:hypothetical protein
VTIVAPHGADRDDLRRAGHLAAWKALPASVRRVVVLRDVPFIGFVSECVRGARAKSTSAPTRCLAVIGEGPYLARAVDRLR